MNFKSLFKRILQFNISQKFSGYLIVVSVIPLLVVGLISYLVSRNIIQEEASGYTVDLISEQTSYLDLLLQEVDSLISNISGVEEITNTLDAQSADTYTNLATQARIGYILNSYSNIKGLASIDIFTTGGAHYHVGETLNAQNIRLAVRDRLLAQTEPKSPDVVWVGIEDNVNADSSYTKVITATKVFSQLDPVTMVSRTVAMLVVSYRVGYLYSHFSSLDLGNSGYLMIIDGQNRIVFNPNQSLIGGVVGADYMKQFSGKGGTLTMAVNGKETSVTYKRSAISNWVVASFIPVEALTSKTNIIGVTTFVILAMSFVLVTLMTFVYTRNVVTPIREITLAFKSYEKGTPSGLDRLVERGQDEIGELIRWFNTFVDNQLAQKRTEAALRERDHYLSLLNDITLAALQMPDLESMLNSLSNRMGELLNADGCYILFHDETRQIEAASSGASPFVAYLKIVDNDGAQSFRAMVSNTKSGGTITIEDVNQSKYFSPSSLEGISARSILILPLKSSGENYGAVMLYYNQLRQFLPAEVAYSEQAAAQISLAIARVTLLEETQNRVQIFEMLYETARVLSSLDDLSTLYERLNRRAITLLNGDVGFIFLYRHEHDDLELMDIQGVAAHPGVTLPLGQGIPGRAAAAGQPLIVNDLGKWETQMPSAFASELSSLIVVPVFWGGELLGVLGVGALKTHPRYFVEMDAQLLSLLGGVAAGVIKKTQMVDETLRFNEELEKGIEERTIQLEKANKDLEGERTSLARRVAERTTELSMANTELARAVRTKDEFLANMSHELRTPLNAILGLTEALEEETYGPINDRQVKPLRTIVESGQHLLTLINDILDLSKIEAGKLILQPDWIEVEPLCYSSLQFVKQQALKKSIQVSLKIDPTISELWVDKLRMKQILVNLLTNAVKFTPEGGKVGLDVTPGSDQKVICFTVWDSGIGISPEDQNRLFKPFVQIDGSLARQHEGTGLGLALVSRLVEMHGGSVTLESEVGKGSRFIIRINRASHADQSDNAETGGLAHELFVDLPGPARIDLPADDLPESKLVVNSRPGSEPLILLAEDNEANIYMISNFLAARGCRINVARNGREAEASVLQEIPDLILMDMQMPEMDGLEATKHIRAYPAFVNIPIIALTALAMPGDRERCLAAGVNDYMTKPVGLKNLVKLIRAYLQTINSGAAQPVSSQTNAGTGEN